MADNFIIGVGVQLNSTGKELQAKIDSISKTTKIGINLDFAKAEIEAKKHVSEMSTLLQKELGKLNIKVSDSDAEKIVNDYQKAVIQAEKAQQKAIENTRKEQEKLVESMAKVHEQSELKSNSTKQMSEIAQAQAINKALEDEYKENLKLADAMAKVREQSEIKNDSFSKKSELSQTQAINKAIEDEYLKVQKIKSGMDSLGVSISNTSKKFDMLSSPTKELQENIQRVYNLQNKLGSSTGNKEIISTYEELNGVLEKVKLQITEISNSEKISTYSSKLVNDFDKLSYSVTSFANNNPKAIKDGYGDAFTDLSSRIELAKQKMDSVSLKNLTDEFSTLKKEIESTGSTGDTAFSKLNKNLGQFVSFLASGTIIMSGVNAIRNMVSEVVNLDGSLTDLRQATGYTDEQAKNLLSTYIDLGQQIGATGTEIADGAANWLRQGKSIAETNTLLYDSMVLSKIGQVESADSTKYLTSITKGYKIAVEDTLGVVDKLSAVDLSSATDVSGLAQAVSEVATNAQLAGVSLDKLLGYLAVVGETTGEQMSAVGNSFSTMFSRMGNIKLSRLTDPETGEDLSNVETSLGNLGIKLRDTNDTFRNFGDVLDEVAGKWSSFSDVNKRAVASSIAGKEHMEDFLVLMSNYGKATEYAGVSADSAGTAMKKFEVYEESVEAKTKKLQASFQELATDTLNSGLVKSFLDLSNVLLQVVDKVGILNIAVVGFAGFLGAKGLLNLTSFAEALASLEKIVTSSSGAFTLLGDTMSAALPVAAIIGGIYLVSKAIDALVVSDKELAETHEKSLVKVNDSITNYENLTKTLTDLKDEQESVTDKLNELYGLRENQTITKAEEDYLSTLEEQNTKLQKQIEYQQTLTNIAAKKTENEAVSTLGEKTTGVLQRTSDGNVQLDNSQKLTDVDKIEYYTKEINHLNNELQNYQKVVSGVKLPSDEIKKYSEQLKYYQQMLKENPQNSNILQPKIDFTKSLLDGTLSYKDYSKAVEETTKQQQEFVSENDKLINSVQPLSDSIVSTSGKNHDLKESIDNVISDASKATITFGEFTGSLINSASATDRARESTEQATKTIAEWKKEYKSAKDEISTLSSILDEVNSEDYSGLSQSSIDTILDKYPSLVGYIHNESELRKRLTSIIEKQKSTAQNAYIQMRADSNAFYNSLMNGEADRVNAANNAINSIINSNKTLVDTLGANYQIDLKNFKSIADAKARLEEQLIQNSAKAWAQYYRVQVDASSGQAKVYEDTGLTIDPSDTPEERKKKINAYAKAGDAATTAASAYNKAISELSDISKTVSVSAGTTGSRNTSSGKTKSGDSGSSSKNTFDENIDWRARAIEELKQKADDLNSTLDNTKSVSKQIEIYNSLIKVQQRLQSTYSATATSYKKSYQSQLSKLGTKSDYYQKLIESGSTFKVSDFKNEKTYNTVKEAQEAYDNWQQSKQAAKEAGYEAKKTAETIKKINYNDKISKFENELGKYENQKQDILNDIDEAEAKGNSATAEQYKKLIAKDQAEIDVLTKEAKAIVSKRDSYKQGTAEWKEYDDNLQNVQDKISDLIQEQYTYNQSIEDINEEKIQKLADAYDALFTELDFYTSKIKDEDLFNTDSNDNFLGISDDYLTKIALLQTGLATTESQVKDLKKQINALDKTDANYSSDLEDLTSKLYTALNAQDSYKQSIEDTIDVIKNAEIDALNDKLDAYSKLVDAQKDALQSEKDLHDYEKSISDTTNEIENIQSRITELKRAANTGDREAQKELKTLQDELASKQSELDETKYNRQVELQQDALDDSYDAYQDSINDQIDDLENYYDKQKKLIENTADYTASQMKTVLSDLYNTAEQYGIKLSDNLLSSIQSAMNNISVSLSTDASSTNISSNNGGSSYGGLGSYGTSFVDSVLKDKIRSILSNGSGSANSSSELNKYIVGTLGYKPLSYAQMALVGTMLGVSGFNSADDIKGNDSVKNNILSALKKLGKFKNGGEVKVNTKSLVKQATGEDAIVSVSDGEGFLTAPQYKDYNYFKNMIPNMIDLFTPITSALKGIDSSARVQTAGSNITLQFDSLMRADNVSSDFDIKQAFDKNFDYMANKLANAILTTKGKR